MASLQKKYDKEKRYGQIYTPPLIVAKILDEVGFASSSVLGKTILDPACGDGRFLIEVVKRIAKMSHREDLEKNLAAVHGWDIDEIAVEQCKENLTRLIEAFGVQVNWNVSARNALHQLPKRDMFVADEAQTFDFIVGNPPYIRIQHLEERERKWIQRQYDFCKSGSTDSYIAFFELAYELLKPTGIAGFITPNTFFYTETAKACRDFFVAKGSIKKIINYGDIQLFDNATTYSAITIFTKARQMEFDYYRADSLQSFQRRTVATRELHSQKIWRLSFEESSQIKGKRLGDICHIHVGITTLCDKAYIFPIEPIDNETVWACTKLKGKIKLERAILKPIVKASTLKHSGEPIKEYVLFPYQKANGKMEIIPEAVLQEQFPLAYRYLRSVKSELDKRDNGRPNPVAWYAFGRSQSLDTSFGKKVIFSPMNLRPNFVLYENEDCTVYSGYFIKYDGDMRWLLERLNSAAMERFIAVSSRDFRGAWKAYSKKAIEEFIVPP